MNLVLDKRKTTKCYNTHPIYIYLGTYDVHPLNFVIFWLIKFIITPTLTHNLYTKVLNICRYITPNHQQFIRFPLVFVLMSHFFFIFMKVIFFPCKRHKFLLTLENFSHYYGFEAIREGAYRTHPYNLIPKKKQLQMRGKKLPKFHIFYFLSTNPP